MFGANSVIWGYLEANTMRHWINTTIAGEIMVVFWQIKFEWNTVVLRFAKKAQHIFTTVRASIRAYFPSSRKRHFSSFVHYAKFWQYKATMSSALRWLEGGENRAGQSIWYIEDLFTAVPSIPQRPTSDQHPLYSVTERERGGAQILSQICKKWKISMYLVLTLFLNQLDLALSNISSIWEHCVSL